MLIAYNKTLIKNLTAKDLIYLLIILKFVNAMALVIKLLLLQQGFAEPEMLQTVLAHELGSSAYGTVFRLLLLPEVILFKFVVEANYIFINCKSSGYDFKVYSHFLD